VTYPSGRGEWCCYALLALCRNWRAVGPTYQVPCTIRRDSPNSDTLHIMKGLVSCINGCPNSEPV
jgi:hypothetical protein